MQYTVYYCSVCLFYFVTAIQISCVYRGQIFLIHDSLIRFLVCFQMFLLVSKCCRVGVQNAIETSQQFSFDCKNIPVKFHGCKCRFYLLQVWMLIYFDLILTDCLGCTDADYLVSFLTSQNCLLIQQCLLLSRLTNINPFTARACKISRLKDAWTLLQAVYFPVLQHIIL